MSARLPPPFLRHDSDLWRDAHRRTGCENLIELVSQSRDPDYAGLGSSAFQSDTSGIGVVVPAFATTSPTNRFLFRLAGIQIPGGFGIIIRGLRLAQTIRTVLTATSDDPYPIELEVTSPFWHFNDGNVSYHLMHQGDSQTAYRNVPDTGTGVQLAGTSPDFRSYGAGSSLLYRNYDSILRTYTAPSMGRPPGSGVAHLGNIHDLRYPWENTDWSLHLPVMGPGAVVLYASVFQPNVGIRPAFPGCSAISVLRPEDQFVAAFPDAVYGRVAGALTVELFPCCGART